MNKKAVGIFDSGFGGLTALEAFKEYMPDENIIFFGDTLNVPYGSKSVDELHVLAKNNLDFLKSKGVKTVIAACGTVSSNCNDLLKNYDIYVENVLDATLEYVKTLEGKVGVIATEATIKAGAFKLDGREVKGVACPDFVTLIESGHTSKDDALLNDAIDRYLSALKDVDILILGCTHYGIIKDAIKAYMGEQTKIVSASQCASYAMAQYLKKNDLTGGDGITEIYTSGDTSCFDEIATRIIDVKRCNYKCALNP